MDAGTRGPVGKRSTQLNAVTLLGTGVMLWANVPITVFFSRFAMREQRFVPTQDGLSPQAGPA